MGGTRAQCLRHRHIVHLIDVGFDGDSVYAVSEPCDGDTLRHYLLPDRSLSLEETVSLMLPRTWRSCGLSSCRIRAS